MDVYEKSLQSTTSGQANTRSIFARLAVKKCDDDKFGVIPRSIATIFKKGSQVFAEKNREMNCTQRKTCKKAVETLSALKRCFVTP